MVNIHKLSDTVWHIERFIEEPNEVVKRINNWKEAENLDGSIKYLEAEKPLRIFLELKENIDKMSYIWLNEMDLNKATTNSNEIVAFQKKGPSNAISTHKDTVNGKIPVLSILTYYSDNFEGGELVIPSLDISIKPKAGDAIFITGDIEHAVTEIISGERIIGLLHFIDYPFGGNANDSQNTI